MSKREIATFAGGCFWCTEAVFKMIKGVEKVTAGYAGGERENPTYEDVSAGKTGHVEAVQLEFDPTQISYPELLEIFWHTHDPSQRESQGPDVGPQYQAAIFYHDEAQKKAAEKSRKKMVEAGPVETLILPYKNFYPAEEHHQDYFAKNPHAPYCRIVIQPKVKKVAEKFHDQLKNP